MYQIVNDEKEAQHLSIKANTVDYKNVFCPLINSMCRADCICFTKAKYLQLPQTELSKKEYVVTGGCCNNHMFFGDE